MPKATAKSPKCASCDESMEMGYVTRSMLMTPLQPFIWVAGRPMTPANLGASAKRKKTLVVTAWRCNGCGRLDSFAN